MVEHSITLEPGAKPVYIPAYKIPHSRRQILIEYVMLQQGLIQPSISPWSAPMLLVPKRQHGFRPVCDFRRLNKVTVPSPFPIPNLRQLLQDIGGDSKIFSSIDLAKGFLQVPLAEDSRPYTAFSTHVKSFLGLAGFYRPFIKDYGRIAAPLTYLLKKDVPWRWDEEQVKAFTKLKNCLSLAPVLAFPKFDLPFILHTDASNVGLGAVLMQEHKGNLRPVGFASRVLTSAEKNYSVTDREMLAIVWALKYSEIYTRGTRSWSTRTTCRSHRSIMIRGRRARYQDIPGRFRCDIRVYSGPRKCRRRHAVTRANRNFAPFEAGRRCRFPPFI
ncbi:hypothetical protein C7M84_022694 [Penaeus vannamei]|uniref:RNA-directed DNA polymerase n=1 Tax=Penaeus vannamei TaxID=6689 RepID=A0A423U5Z8_PENVA|nr:hypothetical protein C7M84_022694 [Penaeus vannamei]